MIVQIVSARGGRGRTVGVRIAYLFAHSLFVFLYSFVLVFSSLQFISLHSTSLLSSPLLSPSLALSGDPRDGADAHPHEHESLRAEHAGHHAVLGEAAGKGEW